MWSKIIHFADLKSQKQQVPGESDDLDQGEVGGTRIFAAI